MDAKAKQDLNDAITRQMIFNGLVKMRGAFAHA